MSKEVTKETEQSERPQTSLVSGTDIVTNGIPKEADSETEGQGAH